MNPIVTAILALITAAPTFIVQIEALWTQIKSGVSTSDQAVVDTVLSVLNPKTDADVAQLHTDAAAG